MQTINLQVNGKPLVFTGQSVSYAGHVFYYNKMSNIAHRGGEQPAYLFDYEDKRLALPYDPKDKDVTLKIFKQVSALEKKRKETPPEPPKEEPIEPASNETPDFSFTSPVPEPQLQPNASQRDSYSSSSTYVEKGETKGYLSVGRLVIGIISMVLFIFIAFQSCAAGLSNALQSNDSLSGSAGIMMAIMLLVAGIVAVCTRKKVGIVGLVITAVLYFIGAIFTIGTGDTYGDLPIWGALSTIFGLVFVFCAVKTKLGETDKPFYKPYWLIAVVVAVSILALIVAFAGSSNDNSTKDNDKGTTTEQNKSQKVEKISLDNDEGSLTFVKSKTTKDYDGKPAALIYFKYTNKRSEPGTAPDTFYSQVFQNGVECETTMPNDDIDAVYNASKDVQKGTEIEIALTYTLQDTKNPITLKVSDQSTKKLLDNIYQEQEITLK